jgi:hypothetical protein
VEVPPQRGGDFQGIGAKSPPGYPLAWLHPCRARSRVTWQTDCIQVRRMCKRDGCSPELSLLACVLEFFGEIPRKQRTRRQPDHPTRHSITARSATRSTVQKIRSIPLESLISRVPDRGRISSSFAASTDRSCATLTATSRVSALPPSYPSRYSLLQWNTVSAT